MLLEWGRRRPQHPMYPSGPIRAVERSRFIFITLKSHYYYQAISSFIYKLEFSSVVISFFSTYSIYIQFRVSSLYLLCGLLLISRSMLHPTDYVVILSTYLVIGENIHIPPWIQIFHQGRQHFIRRPARRAVVPALPC